MYLIQIQNPGDGRWYLSVFDQDRNVQCHAGTNPDTLEASVLAACLWVSEHADKLLQVEVNDLTPRPPAVPTPRPTLKGVLKVKLAELSSMSLDNVEQISRASNHLAVVSAIYDAMLMERQEVEDDE